MGTYIGNGPNCSSSLLQERASVCAPYAIRLEFSSKLSELMKQYSATDRVTALSTQVPTLCLVSTSVLLRWHH